MNNFGFCIILLFACYHAKQLTFKYLFFEQTCFDVFFTQLNFFHIDCIKLTISKLLGYGVIFGSLLVKTPQIYKIVKAKSIFGISFQAVILEAIVNNLQVGYSLNKNNPFSIYGENVFLSIANMVIIFCFFIYTKEKLTPLVLAFLFLVSVAAIFLLGFPPQIVYNNTPIAITVLLIMSKGSQILETNKNKSTGNLAFITNFLNLIGVISRFFTVYTQVKGETLFLLSSLIPVVINAIIIIQFYLYWNNPGPVEAKKNQ